MSDLDQTTNAAQAREMAGEVRLMSPIDFPGPRTLPRGMLKSDVLVLDIWEGNGTAFEIELAGQPRVRTSFPLPDLFADPGLADPAVAAELHKSLVSLDVKAREAVVVLPESIVKHTELTLPRLPRRALHAVLAQKAREIDGMGEAEIIWGYQASEIEGTGQRHVLLFAALRSELMRVHRGLLGVGLTAVAMVPSLAVLLRLSRSFLDANGANAFALVLLERDRARLSLFKKNILFYDRCVRLGDDADGQRASLMRQVQRALLNYQQHHQEDPVRQLFIADGDLERGKQLASDLVTDLLLPVSTLSPSWLLPHEEESLPAHAAPLNGHLAGALLLLADRSRAGTNLLPPELRTRKRDRLMGVIVIAIALLSWGTAVLVRTRLGEDVTVVRQIAALQKQELELLVTVPDRYAEMLALRNRVRDEATKLRAAIGPSMDYDALFNLLSNAMTGDLQLTAIHVDAREESPKGPPGTTASDSASSSERRRQWSLALQGICPRKYLEAQAIVQEAIKRLSSSPLMISVTPGPLQQSTDSRFGAVTRFEIRGTIGAGQVHAQKGDK